MAGSTQTAREGESRSLEGRAPWEPRLGRGAWRPPAMADASLRHMRPYRSSHLTEALAGVSSEPSQLLLCLPRFPTEASELCWPMSPTCLQETLGGVPKVLWSDVPQRQALMVM